MLVVLIRHAPAEERDSSRWPDDLQRPLTDHGRERAGEAALGLARLIEHADEIWTSPSVRTTQSAKVLAEALEGPEPRALAALEPGGSPRAVIERLAKAGDRTVLLVGHEPDLGRLAGQLVFGAPRALPLKKCGACAIEFDDAVEAGRGQLRWLATPRMLRACGRKRVKA